MIGPFFMKMNNGMCYTLAMQTDQVNVCGEGNMDKEWQRMRNEAPENSEITG